MMQKPILPRIAVTLAIVSVEILGEPVIIFCGQEKSHIVNVCELSL